MSNSTHSKPLFLVSGGGTGGHVYPSLAVAAALERAGNVRVAYVGSVHGMEGELVRRESALPFYGIHAAAVRGRSLVILIRNIWLLLVGLIQSLRLLQRERPVAIFGTGGYVCVPLFVAAWLLRIPRAIYLPDVVPGLAVRFLTRLSTVTLGSIEDAAPNVDMTAVDAATWRHNPRQMAVAGYPVRSNISKDNPTTLRNRLGVPLDMPLVLVYGGSLGARSINRAVAPLLPTLLAKAHVLHVCGREGDVVELLTHKQQLPTDLQSRYHLYPYLAADGDITMPEAFVAADVAICRSGASTLGELPAAQLPAVLVPYPYVHQDENADYLVRHGAAIKVHDHHLNDDLWPAIAHLITDKAARFTMQSAMAKLARPHAADDMAQLLQRIARGA